MILLTRFQVIIKKNLTAINIFILFFFGGEVKIRQNSTLHIIKSEYRLQTSYFFYVNYKLR